MDTMEKPRIIPESTKRMWVSKLTLRVVSAILDLVLIGASAQLNMASALIFFLPPAIVACVWNITEGIAILARGGRRGIHPGACVGVDLLLWLAFCAVSIIYLLYGYGWYYWAYDSYYDGPASFPYHLAIACLVVGFLEAATHFALFIIACVETSKRNNPPTIVYYQPKPGAGVEHMNNQQMPQNYDGHVVYSQTQKEADLR